jgi:hypothetical protein
MNFVSIISSRDAKLVYGCDVEERRRYRMKAFKRAKAGRVVAAPSVISSCMDEHSAKLNRHKYKVWHEI